jgi:hypothetical protein
MTDTAVTIPQADIEALMRSYTFREQDEVVQFLAQYPFLIPVLLEAPEKIRQYFPDSQLFLEVVPDAEVIDWVQLVLSILTNLEPYKAVNKLHQLDRDWWLNNTSHEIRKQLFTLLEYPDEL